MQKRANKQTAEAAYKMQLDALAEQIKELQALHAEASKETAPSWGRVGDVISYNQTLSQVTDRFMRRGEFA